MSKKDVDEKLMDWNKIFEELTLDTKALIKDLLEGINYIAFSALIMILIGSAALIIGIDRGGAKYAAMGLIIFSIAAGNGAMTFRKWWALKKKYELLNALQGKLQS
jgi:hypothetical protein